MKFGKLIGAIHNGETAASFIIFKAGTDEIVCYETKPVPNINPKNDWWEKNPMDLYKVVVDCIQCAIEKLIELGASAEDIVAIGITNQRDSTVVWQRYTGKPLYNVITWIDERTTATVDELMQSIPSNERDINYLRPLCGLPLCPYFLAVKLRWLQYNVPKVKEAIEDGSAMVGSIDSWLIYKLTGGVDGGIHVTDVTNASRTMLMNLETLKWDPILLEFFGLPRSILPEICSNAEVYGNITLDCLDGVPITACLGNQQATLVGHQCFGNGQVNVTYGTGCFLLYTTGTSIVYSNNGLLTTIGYQLGRNAKPVYALEGSYTIACNAFLWLRDNLGIINSFEEIEFMAQKVRNTLDVYFVPAFSGLWAPYWNSDARGVICGLTEETTSEHLVRATLEAIGFQLRDIVDALKKDCEIPIKKLLVNSSVTFGTLLFQLLADLTGITVVRSYESEAAALGTALAAYSVVEPSFNITKASPSKAELGSYNPVIKRNERDMRYHKWKMAIERSLNWEISALIEEGCELFE